MIRILRSITTRDLIRAVGLDDIHWSKVFLATVAVSILGLMLIPQNAWHHAANNAVYLGFDRNLMYANPTGGGTTSGTVSIDRSSIQMYAPPGAHPTVDVLSSDLDFTVNCDLIINRTDAAQVNPLTLKVWTPRETAALVLQFGPGPANIMSATVTGPNKSFDLGVLGRYATGVPYAIGIALDRSHGRLSVSIAPQSAALSPIRLVVDSSRAPALFYRLPDAITFGVAADTEAVSASIYSYRLVIPAQPGPLQRVDDSRMTALLIGAAVAAILLVVWSTAVRMQSGFGWLRRKPSPASIGKLAGMLAFAAIYVIANASLFGLGSHTFDMTSQKIWAYVGAFHGPTEITLLSSTASPSQIFGGVPFADVGFPYGPAMTMFFTALGWVYRLGFVGMAGPSAYDLRLEELIKVVNVVATLVDSVLIYLILRQARLSERLSRVAAVIFLLDPAVWFITSVWGATQTVTLSLLLGAVAAAQRKLAPTAWTLLGVAVLTRPQLAVPCGVLGLSMFRWYGTRSALNGLAWATIAAFLLCLPLMFAFGPSLPVSYLLNVLHGQTPTDPSVAQFNYVSFDGYNIWPLVTQIVSGQSGHERIYFPDGSSLLGPITYRGAATAAVLFAMVLVVAWTLWRGKGTREHGSITTLLATSMLAVLVFDTGVSAQHFLIPLAFVVLSVSLVEIWIWVPLVALLSATTLTSTYGSLGFDISAAPELAPRLASVTNPITRYFMEVFVDNRIITLGVLSNLVVLLVMAVATLTTRREAPSPGHTKNPSWQAEPAVHANR